MYIVVIILSGTCDAVAVYFCFQFACSTWHWLEIDSL